MCRGQNFVFFVFLFCLVRWTTKLLASESRVVWCTAEQQCEMKQKEKTEEKQSKVKALKSRGEKEKENKKDFRLYNKKDFHQVYGIRERRNATPSHGVTDRSGLVGQLFGIDLHSRVPTSSPWTGSQISWSRLTGGPLLHRPVNVGTSTGRVGEHLPEITLFHQTIQLIDQSINQPINQPKNQSINQLLTRSLLNQSINRRNNQSTALSINQSNKKRSNDSLVNQTINSSGIEKLFNQLPA